MRLPTFTDYSLCTLITLTTHEERLCTVKEMSTQFGVNQNHMMKVVPD